MIVIALAIIGPIEGGGYARIAAAAAAEGDGPPSDALRRQMADPRLPLMTATSVVLYALVVLDTVIKPFR